MLKVCPVCGHENPDTALFCVNCGARLPESGQSGHHHVESASEKLADTSGGAVPTYTPLTSSTPPFSQIQDQTQSGGGEVPSKDQLAGQKAKEIAGYIGSFLGKYFNLIKNTIKDPLVYPRKETEIKESVSWISFILAPIFFALSNCLIYTKNANKMIKDFSLGFLSTSPNISLPFLESFLLPLVLAFLIEALFVGFLWYFTKYTGKYTLTESALIGGAYFTYPLLYTVILFILSIFLPSAYILLGFGWYALIVMIFAFAIMVYSDKNKEKINDQTNILNETEKIDIRINLMEVKRIFWGSLAMILFFQVVNYVFWLINPTSILLFTPLLTNMAKVLSFMP